MIRQKKAGFRAFRWHTGQSRVVPHTSIRSYTTHAATHEILLSGLISVITLFTPLYAQTTADEEQVKNVIVDAFQALADLDMAKFRSYCQPDFMLLENGEIWTVDTLEARMKPRIGSGMRRINTIDFERVTVKGNIAWVTYNNQADIDAKGQKRTIKWLESAVLEKERRGWKMTLLHSTVLLRKN